MNLNQKSQKYPTYSLLILAVLFFAFSMWGAIDHGWWTKSIWDGHARDSLILVALALIVVNVAGLVAGISFAYLLLLPILVFSGLSGVGAVASVFWYWICATVIGAYALKKLRDDSHTLWSVRNSGAGFAITGSLVGLMVHFPINTPTLYLFLISGAALLAAWRLGLLMIGSSYKSLNLVFRRRNRSMYEISMLAIILLSISLVLFVTALPEFGHDALAMHLTIPARILEAKKWSFDVTQYIWSAMPFGANWLMLPPYFLAGEPAAKLMDSSFVLATAWLSYRILLPRIGSIMALAAPALFLTLPLTIQVSGSVYAEPIIAFLFLLCLSELTGTSNKSHGSWLFLAMITGYACSSKLLSAPLIPVLIAAAFVLARKQKFQVANHKIILASAIVFLLISIEPYLVAYLKTGNPVFPFYNTIFKSPFFRLDSAFNNGHSFANPWFLRPLSTSMLWESSINSKIYGEYNADGAVGILFLILIPLSFIAAVQFRRWWVLIGLLVTLGYCILVFQSQAYLRYIYQVLPWLIIFGVWALARLPRCELAGTSLVLLMCIVNLTRIPVAYAPINQFSLSLLFDRSANRKLLEINKPAVVVGDLIQQMGSLRDKKIFLIGTDPIYSHYPANLIALSWHSWPFYWAWVSSGHVTNLTNLLYEFDIELIVHPVGQGEPHEADLLAMTDEVFATNGMRIGLVKPRNMTYDVEQVRGPSLKPLNRAWNVGNNELKNDGVLVTVSHPITQEIDVKGNRRALLKMKVSCSKGHNFRSQINWLSTKGEIDSVDIEVHPCGGDETQVERVIKIPPGITKGVLYGSSYDESSVLIQSISLRTPH